MSELDKVIPAIGLQSLKRGRDSYTRLSAQFRQGYPPILPKVRDYLQVPFFPI